MEIIKKEKKNKKRASVEIQNDIKKLKKEITHPIESPKKKKVKNPKMKGTHLPKH